MKAILVSLLLYAPILVVAQTLDSSIIRQVDSLIQISRTLTGQGKFDEALEVNSLAEKTALEKLGRESAGYGSCCQNQGRIYYFRRDYVQAEKWFLEAISIRKKVLGTEHPDYAESLLLLGMMYGDLRKNGEAAPLFLESMKIRKKYYGAESREYAFSLSRILWADMVLGNLDESLIYCLEFQHLSEKLYGKNHPNYAWSLYYLGYLYQNQNRFDLAEQNYLEAKEIFETVPNGKRHAFYLLNLNALGGLYHFMGRYSEAESIWTEVRDFIEKTYGKTTDSYALSLVDLGMLYSRTNRPDKAEACDLEAKSIYEKLYGDEHYMVAACKTNLGLLYSEAGRYAEAEQLLLESIATMEKQGNNPTFAYLNLARLYEIQGRYDDAEKHLLKALSLWRSKQESESPEYVKYGIFFLAYIYERQGKYLEADSLLSAGSDMLQTLLTKTVNYLSERELSQYLLLFEALGDHLCKFLAKNIPVNDWYEHKAGEAAGTRYDHILFYKGYLLQSSQRIKASVLADTVCARSYQDLISIKNQLAREYSKSNPDSNQLQDLETRANNLEKELSKTVAGFGESTLKVSWADVQKHLKKNEAAIEFIHFQYGEWAYFSDSILYTALVLRPDNKPPVFIPLFEKKQLDSLLSRLGNRQADSENGLYASRGVKPLQDQNLESLFDLVWKPMEGKLPGIQKIYFSPTGILHRLNFNAIPLPTKTKPEGKYLSDRYLLIELGSTRQLALVNDYQLSTNDAILFGGLAYGNDSVPSPPADRLTIPDQFPGFQPEMASRSIVNQNGIWEFLPGTKQEIESIGAQLKQSGFNIQMYRGKSGTEEEFKNLGKNQASPRILHLATHGFFFPDPKIGEGGRGMKDEEPVFKMSDQPMIRSGLILAGGNYAWQTGKPLKPDMEDGILTAYEISQINLSNTELVVLSACETGLGDIQGNEGVYGLQRAFKIAGAKYLIMSLWQVPDKETSVFMTTFYKNWLEAKMTIPEAFRTTQKEMRERFINPYQWAGFVLVE